MLIVLLALISVGATGALLGMAWYEFAQQHRYKDEKRKANSGSFVSTRASKGVP
jgi:hypothetical protein